MAWEDFDKKYLTEDKEPVISITKYQRIYISKSCYEKFLKDRKYIKLLFDREKNLIGIKPIGEKRDNSYSLIRRGEQQQISISASAFLRHYGIETEVTKKYLAKWNEEDRLIEINLNQ